MQHATSALPCWLIARPLLPVTDGDGSGRIWAFGWIGVYLLASLAHGFLSDAPWYGDCVSRYFHAREA
ncbi:MAG TPA: hypothetical protein PKY96_01835 [Flavobacteriales bacterium]|nr:hypothetical protein [Flavobacteriales bacterium]